VPLKVPSRRLAVRNSTTAAKAKPFKAKPLTIVNSCNRRKLFRIGAAVERADAEKPSPLEPKPLPGVMTTFGASNFIQNACQLVSLAEWRTQDEGALRPKNFQLRFLRAIAKNPGVAKESPPARELVPCPRRM